MQSNRASAIPAALVVLDSIGNPDEHGVLQSIRGLIHSSKRILVITGAGISVSAGIPVLFPYSLSFIWAGF